MALNSVNLVGYAGKDPEVKFFETGTVKCSFSLAVNRRRKGEEDHPDWFDIELWGKTAEIAGEFVRKGSLVGVSGSLVFSRWQDRSTQEAKERPVIKGEQLDLLARPRTGGGDGQGIPDDEEF